MPDQKKVSVAGPQACPDRLRAKVQGLIINNAEMTRLNTDVVIGQKYRVIEQYCLPLKSMVLNLCQTDVGRKT